MRNLLNNRTSVALWAALLVGLMTVATGCKPKDGGDATPGGETAPDADAKGGTDAAGTLKVGAVLPMSGQMATYGEESLGGMKLAIEEINARGEGPRIELVFKDNKGESTETAKLVTQLIKVDNVNAILGSVASSNTLKGAKVAQENGIPLITPASTNVEITRKGEFVSRICFIDPFQGKVLAKLVTEDLGKKKVAIIVDKASDYSVGLADAFKTTLAAAGGEVVAEETFTAGEADFSALITKVTDAKPEAIFVPAYYGDVGPMLKQAGERWKDIPVVAGDGIDSPDLYKLMGPYQGPIYMSTHFASDDSDPKVKEFVAKYNGKYGKVPGAMAALGYDSVYALHDAAKRAGSSEPNKLKDAINSIKGLAGITGTITLDADRNAQKDAVIMAVSPEGAKFYKRIGN